MFPEKYIFLVHCSDEIGSGHLHRSLSLFRFLVNTHKQNCEFYLYGLAQSKLPKDEIIYLKELNSALKLVLEDSGEFENSCCIIDDPLFDLEKQNLLKKAGLKIVIIDDENTRDFNCDLLINPNYRSEGFL